MADQGYAMPQQASHTYTTGEANVMQRDDEFRKEMESTVQEAAERVTFHRTELERWNRIGRSAGRALNEIAAHDPMPITTAETFVHGEDVAPTPARF